jgi:hypothetical protein
MYYLKKLYIGGYVVSERENIETIPWNQSMCELEIRQILAFTSSLS